MHIPDAVADLLNAKALEYNHPEFIKDDPISIPHQYTKKQDIEITGLWAAVLAWGLRKTIIKKCLELFDLMDHAPHAFVLNHSENDLRRIANFKHRTFNGTDALYFVHFLKWFYSQHESLEEAFVQYLGPDDLHIGPGLAGFHQLFFSLEEAPARTRKHIATPDRNSACKRMNMYLRWMVRKDDQGVDFGIWNRIKPHQLICPCDLHVDRVARRLGLITRKPTDWKTAVELTHSLKTLDPYDPVKYDFALFGMGVMERWA